ncbi:hypothetical protein JCM8097_008988 [Rhodosporidiobolus ruineniae]
MDGDAILSALVSNAALPTPSFPSSAIPTKLAALAATASTTSSTPAASTGFLTSRLADLPSAVPILVGVWLILLGLFTLTCGTRAMYWGKELGRKRGEEGKGWLDGGIGGVLVGSTTVGAFSAFLVLAIVSKQSDPSLGGWATLAIIFFPALIGAVVAGRWEWASKIAYAVLGSLSFTLLLTTSIHLTPVFARDILLLVTLLLALLGLFFRKPLRYVLPALSALSGAYLFVLGIDCLPPAHIGFVDALGLLVADNGVSEGGKAGEVVVEWGSKGGKGLCAAWWILGAVAGAGMGWWGLGNDGDESWETYLSRLIYDHPSSTAGQHLPPLTRLERLRAFFSRTGSNGQHDSLAALPGRRAPWDDEDDFDDAESGWDVEKGGEYPMKPRSHRHREHHHHHSSYSSRPSRSKHDASDAWDSDVETLFPPPFSPNSLGHKNAAGTATVRSVQSNASKPARYGVLSSSDVEEEDEHSTGGGGKDGLWTASRPSMDGPRSPLSPGAVAEKTSIRSGLSGSTAVSSPKGKEKDLGRPDAEVEEDGDALAALPILGKDSGPKLSSTSGGTWKRLLGGSKPKPASYAPSVSSSRSASSLPSSTNSAPPPNSVLATPSLIRALDRVRQAQHEARALPSSPLSSSGPGGRDEVGAPSSPVSSTPRRGKALTRRESVREEERRGGSSESGSGRRASMDEWWADVIRTSEGR